MKRKKKYTSADIAKYAILGTLGVILAVVFGYSLLYIFGITGDSSAAEPYATIQGNEIETAPIEVIEFFSYDCPHCRRLEPFVEKWLADLPEDVTFRRVHIAFSGNTQALAKVHWILKQRDIVEQNHERIFRTAGEGNLHIFQTLETMAEYFDGHGITEEEFKSLFNSQTISRLVDQDQALAETYFVNSVPRIIVGNKYVVLAQRKPETMLEIVSDIITDIQSGTLPVEDEDTTETTETEAP